MHRLDQILILLAAAVVVVALFRRLRLPPILGYLAVGMLVGHESIGLIQDPEEIGALAEFGVVFLLFTIGLEFSVPQLIAMRWSVLGIGGAQVLIASAIFAGLALLTGVSPGVAVILGGALALSSTAIVTKQLAEQLALHTRHGRRAVGILLFQDLAVVPLLIVIPLFASEASNESLVQSLVWAMAKGIGILALLLIAGRTLLRPLFREVAAARSNELFTLAVLLVALLAAWATHLAGLSLALGAFLAGIVLGETEFRHQIESDIRPFRDVLLGLFFITVGMYLDPVEMAQDWYLVIGIAAGMMAFKAGSVYALVRLAGDDSDVAVRTALIIAQGGEFGFAAMSLALSSQLMDPRIGQLVIAAIVVSMALAPLCIGYSEAIARRLTRRNGHSSGHRIAEAVAADASHQNDHVLLCGYGRTGQDMARFLTSEAIPYQALDLDPVRVREARAAGMPVTYGDSSRQEILTAAGVERARLVAITFTEPEITLQIIRQVRSLAPSVPIVVRTRDDARMEELERTGATAVVPEVMEASLMLASHALALLDLPLARVFDHVSQVRADRYRLLRGYFLGENKQDLESSERDREQLRAVTLPEAARAVGQRLGDLELSNLGVQVEAIRRGGHQGPEPEADLILTTEDTLILHGVPEDLERASDLLLATR